jgi:hypothetical protein
MGERIPHKLFPRVFPKIKQGKVIYYPMKGKLEADYPNAAHSLL